MLMEELWSEQNWACAIRRNQALAQIHYCEKIGHTCGSLQCLMASASESLLVSSRLSSRRIESRNSHSPLVELPNSSSKNFFEEAKIGDAERNKLRKLFSQFSTRVNNTSKQLRIHNQHTEVLFLEDFVRMLDYYNVVNNPAKYEAFFFAIDRSKDGVLDFDEFLKGVCAADPNVVHILNSFSGYERGQYIFDYYDNNRSNTLEFTEFARLIADCASMKTNDPTNEKVRTAAISKAKELGILGDAGNLLHFTCVKFKTFYECIQSEKLRGTSRLFRFNASLFRSRRKSDSLKANPALETPMTVRSRPSTPRTHPLAGDDSDASDPEKGGLPAQTSSLRLEDIKHDDSLANFLHDASVEVVCNSVTRSPLYQQLLASDVSANAFVTSAPGGEGFGEEDKSVGCLPPPDLCSATPADPVEGVTTEKSSPTLTWPMFDAATVGEDLVKQGRAAAKKFVQKCLYEVSPEWYVTYVQDAHRDDGRRGLGALDQFASVDDLTLILRVASRILLSDGSFRSSLLENVSAPAKIFGGIYGQLLDLLSLFRTFLPPDSITGDILYTNYVFLGDYIGPGWCNLDTLALVLSLKILYPSAITLLRGKHEAEPSNLHFLAECEERLGDEGRRIWKLANQCFECLPLAVLIEGRVLCVHGSVPSSLTVLEPLKKLKRPLRAPPSTGQPSERISSRIVSEILNPPTSGVYEDTAPVNTKALMKSNRVAMVVRARGEIPPTGVGSTWGARLLTVMSCINYCDRVTNDAAILQLIVDEPGVLRIHPRVITACRPRILKMLLETDNGDADTIQLRWPIAARSSESPRTNRAARRTRDELIKAAIRAPAWTGATISLFTLEVTPEPPGSIMRSIAMRPEHLQRQQAEYQRRRVSLSSSLPPSTVTTIEDNAEAAAG